MKAKGLKMFLVALVILALFSAVVMLLWNFLMPVIFGLGTINFWQAFGLFLLGRILFGGFGAGKMMMMRGMMNHPKNPIREKWMNMTPEERQEFIRKRRQSGCGAPFGRPDVFDKGDFEKNDGPDPHMRNDQA